MNIIVTKEQILIQKKMNQDSDEKVISKIIADKLKEHFPHNCAGEIVKNIGDGNHNIILPNCLRQFTQEINKFKIDCIKMMQTKKKQCSLSLLGGWHWILTKWML